MRLDRDITMVLVIVAICVLVLASVEFLQQELPDSLHGANAPDYVDRGRELVRPCAQCHDLTEGRTETQKGPPLWGVIGSMAGQSLFPYSEGYSKLADGCLVWDEVKLESYLANPEQFMPGSRKLADHMVKSIDNRRLIIAHLKELQHPTRHVAVAAAPDNYRDLAFTMQRMRGDEAKKWRKQGEIEAKKCAACHDLSRKRRELVGPPLWGIVGREVGKVRRFCYSPAFRDWQAQVNAPPVWDERALYSYLHAPQSTIPGTRMLFAGIRHDKKRLALVRYLKRLK
uniref:Cytochrome c, class I n=1 Tax=Magnetococcus massalia (strain MO-1) TaxID=451514 RepID=A0A1S7LQ60_MAGMO|nr:Cytochrome c, class I [Candidatus Magnetococcus massalia]